MTKLRFFNKRQVILRETASSWKHWSQQHVAFFCTFFAWKCIKIHSQKLKKNITEENIFPLPNRGYTYGIFWWLSPVNIHIAMRSGEDTVNHLLVLWVSLLPPWLHWEHWAVAELGAAAALNCGNWRAEATWYTWTCSKLSCKQEHFGLFWTMLGETIFFVQPSIRENMSELSCSTLFLAPFAPKPPESLTNHAFVILFTIFCFDGPFGELVWENTVHV